MELFLYLAIRLYVERNQVRERERDITMFWRQIVMLCEACFCPQSRQEVLQFYWPKLRSIWGSGGSIPNKFFWTHLCYICHFIIRVYCIVATLCAILSKHSENRCNSMDVNPNNESQKFLYRVIVSVIFFFFLYYASHIF